MFDHLSLETLNEEPEIGPFEPTPPRREQTFNKSSANSEESSSPHSDSDSSIHSIISNYGRNHVDHQVRALLPKCDDELANLTAFLDQSNLLYKKVKVEDRPFFCLMFHMKLNPAAYELTKSIGDDVTWEEIQAALKSETMPRYNN